MRQIHSATALLLLLASSLAKPSPVQLEASFVPGVGQPRTSIFSTSDNTPAFGFHYNESSGHFEQRPGGVCNTGQNNSTYLQIRALLPPGQQVTACTFRASWDSHWSTCQAPHLNWLNSGVWITLNTNYYGRVPSPPCPYQSPMVVHFPFNENGWMHVNMTVGGIVHSRRINFFKIGSGGGGGGNGPFNPDWPDP